MAVETDSNFMGFGTRPFGRTKAYISPVTLAGTRFGLLREPPVEVYRHGIERGINIFFWDKMFKNMTAALSQLSSEQRSKLFIVTSIGAGGPRQIRNGITKRLKILGLDRFSSFHLGWVRSRFRIRQSVIDELVSLRDKGLCDNIGLSIHRRQLAFELYQRNIFDIFMLRYNAAHRGLENDFLGGLDPRNRPGVLSYTTTRWGKLLRKPPNWHERLPRPGDLYRFALSHPFVDTVCMSVYSIEEMDSNLAAISEGRLSDEENALMRRFGDAVYASKLPIIGDTFDQSARI